MSVPFATSDLLAGLPHGFFGREGGVSTGDFASNNVSLSVGDDPAAVATNRAAVAAQLGGELVLLRQVHSTTIVTLTERPDTVVEADAMVTDRPGLLLGILTADCAPILFADPEAGIVGAAHAGWKGAVGGIAYATVLAMVALGADPARIRAVIGPTISGASYEIGPERAAEIAAIDAAAATFVATPEGKTRAHLDIPALLAWQLRGAGVGQVADLGLCTYADPARLFSHRWATHNGTRTGRQIALIGTVRTRS